MAATPPATKTATYLLMQTFFSSLLPHFGVSSVTMYTGGLVGLVLGAAVLARGFIFSLAGFIISWLVTFSGSSLDPAR